MAFGYIEFTNQWLKAMKIALVAPANGTEA